MKLKQRNKDEGLTIPNFKTYYKATVIKSVAVAKHQNQWNREIPGLDLNQHEHSQLIFDKKAKATQVSTVCSTNGAGATGHPDEKKLTQMQTLHPSKKVT